MILYALMNTVDVSSAEILSQYYGGSERKIGILLNGQRYIMKFQMRTEFGPKFNHVSEHLGSRIFEELGIESQRTMLATYKGEQVVLCKVFLDENEQFVPFNEVGDSSLDADKEHHSYSYEDIMYLLRMNKKLTKVDETINRFWEIFVIDALLGNFDRHGGNWGFIKNDNRYRLAPVFDNGSCLFPQMYDDAEMRTIISSQEQTDERVYRFPTSQIKLKGKKSSYHDVIGGLAFPECNLALKRIVPKIDVHHLSEIIDETPFITDVHKEFYKHMLKNRFEKILYDAFIRMEDMP